MKGILKVDAKQRIDIDGILNHKAIVDNLDSFQTPLNNKAFELLMQNYLLNTAGLKNRVIPDSFQKQNKVKEQLNDKLQL